MLLNIAKFELVLWLELGPNIVLLGMRKNVKAHAGRGEEVRIALAEFHVHLL